VRAGVSKPLAVLNVPHYFKGHKAHYPIRGVPVVHPAPLSASLVGSYCVRV
jgi:hypothetical protein